MSTDFLSPLGYKFVVQRLPNVSYFAQSVTLPGISMQTIETPNPVAILQRPGDRMVFDPLQIRFKVDENLANFIEMFNWLVGLGHPYSLDQTAALSRSSSLPNQRLGSMSSMISDATLVILNAKKNPSHNVFFRELFPTGLTELTFDSTDSDVLYLEATATFRYQRYEIETI